MSLPWRVGAILVIAGLLSACADQLIRNRSQEAYAQGRYVEAVKLLEEGVRAHPDSVLLRSGLVQTRSDALGESLTQARARIAADRFDEAASLLDKARLIDASNARLTDLDQQLAIRRRQKDALQRAQAQVETSPGDALATVRQALKEDPSHAGLLQLQRSIEARGHDGEPSSNLVTLDESRPISLDFRDAGLRNVLDAVTRSSGIDFVIDKDVRADLRVTISLKQARVQDAIDLLVGPNQLARRIIDRRTVAIYPNTPEKRRDYEDQVVRIYTLRGSDPKSVVTMLKQMARVHDAWVDERTGTLILRDTPESIQLAERMLAAVDRADPEVLLEVEVLEISSSSVTELGAHWPDSFSITPTLAGGGSLTAGNVTKLTRNDLVLGVGGITVNLRREVGDFTTLANPRIRVTNKEKAKVLIGDRIPVVTSTIATGGIVSDSVSYLDVGLKLDVEPTVYSDDDVGIRVALESSSVGSAVKTASGTLAYQINTRNASTVLRLRDGETQLLAGLISKSDSSSSNRVPGLGDLPVLGRLFSSQLDDGARKELALAITPHILRNVAPRQAADGEIWVGTESAPRLRTVVSKAARTDADRPKADAAPVGASAPAAGAPAVPPSVVPPVAASQLSWVGPQQVKAGQPFDLELRLHAGEPAKALQVEVQFEPANLALVSAADGDFFKRDGEAANFSQSNDGRGGAVRFSTLRSATPATPGDGTVVRLRFKAPRAGEAFVNVLGIPGNAGAISPALPAAFHVQVLP